MASRHRIRRRHGCEGVVLSSFIEIRRNGRSVPKGPLSAVCCDGHAGEVTHADERILSFNGRCEEAFRCDERAFGGQLGTIFRYGGSPMEDHVPADWQDKVMHTTLTVGHQVLNGGDVVPQQYEEPKGFFRCR